MKTLNKIPTGKLERTGSLLKAGAKVGVNYIKYYGNKITKDKNEDEALKILNEDNASDIYDSLKELKGSALTKIPLHNRVGRDCSAAGVVDKRSKCRVHERTLMRRASQDFRICNDRS